jgi:hypothetical protein
LASLFPVKVKVGAYQSETPISDPLKAKLLAISTNIKLGWKGLAGTKQQLITDIRELQEKKFFLTIGPRAQCYKTFSVTNSWILVISWSVFPWQALLA